MWSTLTSTFLKISMQVGETRIVHQVQRSPQGGGSHASRHAGHVRTVTRTVVAQKAGCTVRNL